MNITDPILLQRIKQDQRGILGNFSNQVYPGRWKAISPPLGALTEILAQRVSIKLLEEIVQERDNRPNISLTDWNNDYSKRPTQDQFNKEVQAKVKAENDLTQEQNKNKNINIILTKWGANDLNELNTNIQNTVNKSNELEKELKKKDETIKGLEKERDGAKKEANNKQVQINSLTAERDNLKTDNEKVKQQLKDLQESLRKLNNQGQILAVKEMELAEFRTGHAELEVRFNEVNLEQVWRYMDEIFQDYFSSAEKSLRERG